MNSGLCHVTRELCSPAVALVLLRNSEIPTPLTGYTVGSTDISLLGKSFLVRLSFRYPLTNSKVQLFPIPLCCIIVMLTHYSLCFSHKDGAAPHTEMQSYLLQKWLMQTRGGCWHCLFRILTDPHSAQDCQSHHLLNKL